MSSGELEGGKQVENLAELVLCALCTLHSALCILETGTRRLSSSSAAMQKCSNAEVQHQSSKRALLSLQKCQEKGRNVCFRATRAAWRWLGERFRRKDKEASWRERKGRRKRRRKRRRNRQRIGPKQSPNFHSRASFVWRSPVRSAVLRANVELEF